MTNEELLREALKKKGIGPQGSKKLNPELLKQVIPLLKQENIDLVTAAAFICACKILDLSEEEETLLEPVFQNPHKHLNSTLLNLIDPILFIDEGKETLHSVSKLLKKENLTYLECKKAIDAFIKNEDPEWISAALLQSLRLKRETIIENVACLDSFKENSIQSEMDLPFLVDFSDSYDGTNRSHHLSPFVATILASLGIPCLLHGTDSLAPKYGITTRNILEYFGKNTGLDMEQVKNNLSNSEVNCAYLDQSQYFPLLSEKKQFRDSLVKRPLIATFEKLLQPIQAQKNILFTGFVHQHYKDHVIHVLSMKNSKDLTIFNMRGVEGSTSCWPTKPTVVVSNNPNLVLKLEMDEGSPYLDQQIMDDLQKNTFTQEVNPLEFGFGETKYKINKGISVEQMSDSALDVIKGKTNEVSDMLIFNTAMIISLIQTNISKSEAVKKVKDVISSGKAIQFWNRL